MIFSYFHFNSKQQEVVDLIIINGVDVIMINNPVGISIWWTSRELEEHPWRGAIIF